MMVTSVVSQHEMAIASEDDVVLVRLKARALAAQLGFDPFAIVAIVTACSELGRNVWRHAKRGLVRFTIVESGRVGLRVEFDDTGPGIVDIARALAGGNSTVRSLGLGLAGSRRLAETCRRNANPLSVLGRCSRRCPPPCGGTSGCRRLLRGP